MKKNKVLTVCEQINNIKSLLMEYHVRCKLMTDEEHDSLRYELDRVKVLTQKMENRLYEYRDSIERLGFKRKKKLTIKRKDGKIQ